MKTLILFWTLLVTVAANSQTIYTVTKTTDPDPFVYPYNYIDSLCDTTLYGTLQWAIRKVNDTQGACEVRFNISGAGPHVIALNSSLPGINNTVYFNGTSQQGYLVGSPQIVIDGQNTIEEALFIYHSDNSTFEGLKIINVAHGISCAFDNYLTIKNCVIGNLIDLYGDASVGIDIVQSSNCILQGNYIGTDAQNTAMPIQSYGILMWLYSNNNLIGGTNPGEGNIISNCGLRAIDVSVGSINDRISGNLITNCPQAIYLGSGANNDKQPPVITAFENDTLYGTSAPNDIIEIFGSNGDQQVNEFIGSVITDDNGNWLLPIHTTYNFVAASATDANGNSSIFSYFDIQITCTLSFYCSQHTACAGGSVQLTSYCSGTTACQQCYYSLYDQTEGIYLAQQLNNGYCHGIYNDTYFPSTIQNCNMYHTIVLYLSCNTNNTGSPMASIQVWVGCSPTTSSIISSDPDNTICSGQNVNLTCNSPNSTHWFWSTGETTQSITVHPSVTTTYYVTPSNGCGDGPVAQTTIYVNPTPQVTITGGNILCTNETENLTANSNLNNCSYLWNTGSVNNYIQVNTAGTYTVTVTSSQGCSTIASYQVSSSPAISLTTTHIDNICYGWTNGEASVTASNGTPGFTYSWSNGSIYPTISNLHAGTYTVTVMDAHNCSAIASVTVTQPPQIHVNISNTNNLCSGNNSATANVTGGVPGYTYNWSNGQTSQTINLSQGTNTYTVTVTDSHDCSSTSQTTLSSPNPLVLSESHTNLNCFGQANGSVNLSVSGGTIPYQFIWSNNSTTEDLSNIAAGTYTVTVTDANLCTETTQVTITQPSQLSYTIPNLNNALCNGDATGSVTITPNGGTPYTHIWSGYFISWPNGGPSMPSYSASFNNLNAGNYVVTITDAHGCQTTANISITQPSAINATFTYVQPRCFGNSNGSITVNPSGGTPGYTYTWSNNQTTQTALGLTAGNYTVTVTDTHHCTAVFNTTLTQPTELHISTDNLTQSICQSSTDGAITINMNNTGSSPYAYNWSGPSCPCSGASLSNLASGTYIVTVTDHSHCTTTQTFIINGTPNPIIHSTVNNTDPCSCTGNIAVSTPPIGTNYTYTWMNDEYTIGTSSSINNLCEGTYYLTVNNGDCQTTATYTIQLPASFYPALPSGMSYNSNGDIIVTANTTIATGQTYDIPQNIIVNNGVTFIVSDNTTLRFRPLRGLKVNPQATFKLNLNATLTSICPQMWNGVSATYITSNTTVSTTVSLKNGKIFNAIKGIQAWGRINLNISGSEFKNNWEDIEMKNLTNPLLQSNIFYTDAPILLHVQNGTLYDYPKYHVSAYGVTTSFTDYVKNNKFYNLNTPFNATGERMGYGLYLYNSNILLINKCEFTNLWNGINAYNSNSTIKLSTFTNNNTGILNKGGTIDIHGDDVTDPLNRNTFVVGNNGYVANNNATIPCGIQLINTTNFNIFGNAFSDGFIGIYTDATNSSNIVYKNTFINMYASCVSVGANNILYNCNNYNSASTQYGIWGNFPGGDMVLNSSSNTPVANTNQAWYNNPAKSTWNISSTSCNSNTSLRFYNHTPVTFTYWCCSPISGDATDISHCCTQLSGMGQNNPKFDGTFYTNQIYQQTCLDNPPFFSTKSLAASFKTADSLLNVKAYQENVLQSLIDKGNTEQFLASIAILAPNNFTKFYKQLMDASPYLSDTVLVAFMTYPINKPDQKKDVVLANSPLPYRVRPYINQMNINQNFKNQLWAAQNGPLNAHTLLENYIKWLGDFRMEKISSLVVNTISDSLGYKTDSLINYLANSAFIEDRIARFELLVKKSDYSSAQPELNVINGLIAGLPSDKQAFYNDYINTSEIFIEAVQLPDSAADSLIISNQSYLESVASSEFVYAQSTAKSLLEKAGIPQEYNVWLPDGSVSKNMPFNNNSSGYNTDVCEKLVVYPNPSDGNILVKYQLEEGETSSEIRLTASDGKVMDSYHVTDEKGEIHINCNTCISGNYVLSLYVNGELRCSKAVSIKK